MQGWIELKNMDRAMDLFKQMKRNKRVRPDIVTYTLLITGWARSDPGTNGHGREGDARFDE